MHVCKYVNGHDCVRASVSTSFCSLTLLLANIMFCILMYCVAYVSYLICIRLLLVLFVAVVLLVVVLLLLHCKAL